MAICVCEPSGLAHFPGLQQQRLAGGLSGAEIGAQLLDGIDTKAVASGKFP